MEESISLDFHDYITEVLNLQEVDADSYSPLVLAFIGDCVYDLVIKSMIISRGNKPVSYTHLRSKRR